MDDARAISAAAVRLVVDVILTSDPGDLAAFVAAAGTHADIVPV